MAKQNRQPSRASEPESFLQVDLHPEHGAPMPEIPKEEHRTSVTRRRKAAQAASAAASMRARTGEEGRGGQPAVQDTPFASEFEHIELFARWARARAERLAEGEQAVDLSFPRLHATPRARMRAREAACLPRDERDVSGASSRGKPSAIERALASELEQRCRAHGAGGRELVIDRLAGEYGLGELERTIVLLSTAQTVARELLRPVISLGGEFAGALTIGACLRFAELSLPEQLGARRLFAAEAPLSSQQLVRVEGLGQAERFAGAEIFATPQTLRAFFKDTIFETSRRPDFVVESPRASFDRVVLPEQDRARLLEVIDSHEGYVELASQWGIDEIARRGRGLVLLFHGPEGCGKALTAHAVAQHLGKRVLTVRSERRDELQAVLREAFREAKRHDAVLLFDDCEPLLKASEPLFGDAFEEAAQSRQFLSELVGFEGITVLTTSDLDDLSPALNERVHLKLAFAAPDANRRAAIWRLHLPPLAPTAADVDCAALGARYTLSGAEIKAAVLHAVGVAAHRKESTPTLRQADLERGAERCDGPTTDAGQRRTAKLRLADVVLSPRLRAQVEELIAAARERSLVLEKWGIGAKLSYGKGLAALFWGPPGTGKTLCAEAIAAELGRPLLAVSLGGLQSQFVGQTERNIEAVFARAAKDDAVLFFDEVDALLMDRSFAVRRWELSEVNDLLACIERSSGVVLLATNLPSVLDHALARRLAYRLEFSFPQAEERAAIWRALLPPTVPGAAEVDYLELGARFELSGGEIKNAVLKAAFRATRHGAVTQALLAQAAAEELESAGRKRREIGFGGAD